MFPWSTYAIYQVQNPDNIQQPSSMCARLNIQNKWSCAWKWLGSHKSVGPFSRCENGSHRIWRPGLGTNNLDELHQLTPVQKHNRWTGTCKELLATSKNTLLTLHVEICRQCHPGHFKRNETVVSIVLFNASMKSNALLLFSEIFLVRRC